MIIFGSPNRNRSRYNPDTVVIGTQTWALANFAESTLIDGTVIPEVKDNAAWAALTTAAWSNYNNDAPTGAIYGKLYNQFACALIDAAYIPFGWRTPTYTELVTLQTYLGGTTVAGGKMKDSGIIHWADPNIGADNSSGFTALGVGARSGTTGAFVNFNTYFYFWSSTFLSGVNYYSKYLRSANDDSVILGVAKTSGISIRLIKI